MDQKDKKDDKKPGLPPLGGSGKPSGPSIPTLKDTLKPQVKIKGLQAGQSLVERLKAFKKKDLAFILAGLGVLFMAPLAEHFLMSPDSAETGAFKEGWGFRDGANTFGRGGSPYEGGINGLAPGGLAGGASDIITPLNVRDPSQLVLGPGSSQQPPTGATPSAAPPPPTSSTKSDDGDDWKDALKASASSAGRAAAKKALPVPKVPLSNSALRGLGAVSGGGGGTFSLSPISAANVPNRAADSQSLQRVTPAQGFRGAAGARGRGSGANLGALENLKRAAGEAGTDFSRGGSAASALESAASRDLSGGTPGSGGGGGLGAGAEDKAAAQSQSKDSKSAGESLAFHFAKLEREKAIELKWKMIEQQAMMWPKLREKMIETMLMKGLVEPIAGIPGSLFKGIGSSVGGGKSFSCCPPGATVDPRQCVAKSNISDCSDSTKADCILTGGKYIGASGADTGLICYGSGSTADGGGGTGANAAGGVTGPTASPNSAGAPGATLPGISGNCQSLATAADDSDVAGRVRVDNADEQKAQLAVKQLLVAAAAAARGADILFEGRAADLTACRVDSAGSERVSLLHRSARIKLATGLALMNYPSADSEAGRAVTQDVVGSDRYMSTQFQKALDEPTKLLADKLGEWETAGTWARVEGTGDDNLPPDLLTQRNAIRDIQAKSEITSALQRADTKFREIGRELDGAQESLQAARRLLGSGSSGSCPVTTRTYSIRRITLSQSTVRSLVGVMNSCLTSAQSTIGGIEDTAKKTRAQQAFTQLNSQVAQQLTRELENFDRANSIMLGSGDSRGVLAEMRTAIADGGDVKVCLDKTRQSVEGVERDGNLRPEGVAHREMVQVHLNSLLKRLRDYIQTGSTSASFTAEGVPITAAAPQSAYATLCGNTFPGAAVAGACPANCTGGDCASTDAAAKSAAGDSVNGARTKYIEALRIAKEEVTGKLGTDRGDWRKVHTELGLRRGAQGRASEKVRSLRQQMEEVERITPDSEARARSTAPSS